MSAEIWEAVKYSPCKSIEVWQIECGQDDDRVSIADGIGSKADALLIAMAPEMKRALEELAMHAVGLKIKMATNGCMAEREYIDKLHDLSIRSLRMIKNL